MLSRQASAILVSNRAISHAAALAAQALKFHEN
jgi:hypothetical protein